MMAEPIVNDTYTSVTRGRVEVTLEHIGEGICGDYDPDDLEDTPLLRFYVNLDDEEIANASYCTQLIDTIITNQQRCLVMALIMDRVYDAAVKGTSIKKVCEELSWLSTSS